MTNDPVAGFLYRSLRADRWRDQTVCKIVERAPFPDPAFDFPAFLVRFSDGHEQVVSAEQLQPWFPT